MFGLLKNKLASFISGLAGKEEKKETPSPKEETPPRKEAPPEPAKNPTQQAQKAGMAGPAKTVPGPEKGKAPEPPLQKPVPQPKVLEPQEKKPEPRASAIHAEKKPAAKIELRAPAQMQPSGGNAEAPDLSRLEKRASSERKETAPRIGLGTTIKSFFSGEITIGESEVADLIGELELSLLEADVEYGVSMEVASQLRSRLVGMRVPKGEVASRAREAIGQVLEAVMSSQRSFDFLRRVQEAQKPVKILFVGPNGAGKTTTMAKIAHMLSAAGMTSVFSASDTFRAAAIEQTEEHGARLGIKVIKSRYGADPASVAFDAINFARSHGIDAVLIDSAGRQDTNANLLSELKKISRVAKPDLKIYVGESIGGNSLIDQVRAFDGAIGIDGAILTKLDCDAKGGTAISISRATGIPILFRGVGQRYEDLVPFDAHKIAREIMT